MTLGGSGVLVRGEEETLGLVRSFGDSGDVGVACVGATSSRGVGLLPSYQLQPGQKTSGGETEAYESCGETRVTDPRVLGKESTLKKDVYE
ncbi:hypothetical protein E2C01_058116 [Portunus trituberculatus]|uniref:Uncharacterized protein n=1 Tax=Portunus trituberculatus TaxID=210409 RepID=A0A5B7H2B5_PORTR|nr:hypothetical protein [Portunus trituberculatus]